MSVLTPPGVTPTGERIVREIPGVGVITFENYGPGEWMTKKGEPAKKARRRYLLDDEEVDSVSAIVGNLDKPALYYWHEDWGARGAVAAERAGDLQGVAEEDYVKRIHALGLGASAKRDEGADRGTVIHAGLHSLTLGIVPNPADFPAIAHPWVIGSMRAWRALRPQVICSEQIACNKALGYAGRPDLVARLYGKAAQRPGEVALIDYKTGKGKVYDQAHYQTRLYEMALRAEGLEIERIIIVGIDDAGGFEPIDCEATEEDARALVHLHRSRKRVNSGMAVQRKIARAAA